MPVTTKAPPNLKCPDCDFVAENPQGLGAHRRSRHEYVSKNPGTLAERKRLKQKAKDTAPAVIKQRAPYGSRKKARDAAAADSTIKFCPHCGLNLQAVSMALSLASMKELRNVG